MKLTTAARASALAAATVLLSGVVLPQVAQAAAPAATDRLAAAQQRALPEPPSAAQVRAEIDTLVVEAPHSMTGYSRAQFPHWITQSGKCDTREVVLQRDGQGVQTDSECRAVAGTWLSPYDGKTLTAASQVDIDHMVPLANAWRSGADGWTTDRRKAFANDLVHSQLVAVSASSNRSKGDQSPDQWKPPATAYWCTYARAWGDVKYTYSLSITAPEKSALNTMLDTCQ
ncbi:HNH endonuclease family protein [Kitasatospora sp. NPDC096077]|uniref:HNH endonuclease family protein n=1 Tax=Kitasatospora sp. NPDC096077 TaxID=3155544 RepID=UPI00331F505C